MKKKFLTIVFAIYLGLIIYLILSNNLVNILSPKMHIYIYLSVIPFIFMVLTLLFNKKIEYNFKYSDLIFLVPLIMIILSGDFRLSTSLVSNKENVISSNIVDEDDDIDLTKYDFDKVDFEIIDSNYASISDYMLYTTSYDLYEGKSIRLTGLSLKQTKILSGNYFMIGKYLINCCAADAEFSGFVINVDSKELEDNTWYTIEGVIKKVKLNDGSYVMGIKVANIKKVKEETQFIYPCYAYSDTCIDVTKYNLK